MNTIKKLKWAAFLLAALVGCTELIIHEKTPTPIRINYSQVLSNWANGLHKGIQHGYQVIEVRKPESSKDSLVFMVMVYYYVDNDPFIEYHAVGINSQGKIILSENITPPEYENPIYEETTEDKLKHEI